MAGTTFSIANQAFAAFRAALNDVLTALPFNGQCRFDYVNPTTCRLKRFNGRYIMINGKVEEIPSAGVDFPVSGLPTSSLCYAYVKMNAGSMTCVWSTTGHTQDSFGVEVKSDDPTATLVGMAYVLSGPAFANSETQRLVASWHNKQPAYATAITTADRTSVSVNPTYTEFNAEARIEFVCWANNAVQFGLTGGGKVAATSYTGIVCVAVDTLTASAGIADNYIQTSTACGAGGGGSRTLTEGRHVASISGAVSSAGTLTLNGYSRLSVTILQ